MKERFTAIRPPPGEFDAAYQDTFTQYARDENDRIEDETLEAGDHRGIFGTFDLELMFDAGWNASRKQGSPLEHIHPNELPDVPEDHRVWAAWAYNKAVDKVAATPMSDGELMYQAGRILGGGERNDTK